MIQKKDVEILQEIDDVVGCVTEKQIYQQGWDRRVDKLYRHDLVYIHGEEGAGIRICGLTDAGRAVLTAYEMD